MQFHKYTVEEVYRAPRPICLWLARWVGSEGQQWLPMQPGIYTVRRWGCFHKRVTVWGDANNRLLICTLSWTGKPKPKVARVMPPESVELGNMVGEAEALVQMPPETGWRWVRDLLPTDPLPGAYGPDVAAFVAREVAPQVEGTTVPDSTLS